MKKSKELIKIIIVALVSTVIFYFSTDNLIFSGVLLLLWIAYIIFFFRKKLIAAINFDERVDNCSVFVNSFVINLSITNNPQSAFESIKETIPERLKTEYEHLNELSSLDFIYNLKDYFNLPVYHVFCDTLAIFNLQGGDVFSMFSEITEQLTNLNSRRLDMKNSAQKSFVNLALLWGLSVGILLICRFTIAQFYAEMMKSIIFVALVFALYLLVLFSFHLYFQKFTSIGRNNK